MSPAEGQEVLPHEVSGRPVAGGTVAVLLHGRGSDRFDLQGLRPLLPSDWVLVTPEAPFSAAAWGYGPGSAWYRYVEDDRLVPETLATSLERLGTLLERLPALLGVEPGRLVLGGFSQGGTTSLAYALAHPGRLAAVLVFSGFLPASVALDAPGAAPSATPIFWGHGTVDPAIPFALAERGRARLVRAGAPLTARDYPIGHGIAPEEVRDAVAMVEAAAGV
ncbi:MAG TPA: alpha/beta hydrolase-fold protein [Longimicrobiales bacterium]|nr:alpha/beta hydrolase-fold protein [Longimicrobiales bacterium]